MFTKNTKNFSIFLYDNVIGFGLYGISTSQIHFFSATEMDRHKKERKQDSY